jgi:uncharacterized protein YjiS (DUF1127 family)
MAASTHINESDVSLFGRVHAVFDGIKAAHERRKVFRSTLSEMSALNNRELADLGLNRSELRRVAYQAACEVS